MNRYPMRRIDSTFDDNIFIIILANSLVSDFNGNQVIIFVCFIVILGTFLGLGTFFVISHRK